MVNELLHGMWNLPRPGNELVSPALSGGFLSTVSPRKSSLRYIFIAVLSEPVEFEMIFEIKTLFAHIDVKKKKGSLKLVWSYFSVPSFVKKGMSPKYFSRCDGMITFVFIIVILTCKPRA